MRFDVAKILLRELRQPERPYLREQQVALFKLLQEVTKAHLRG
jgi:hypothetical protein